nr:uncharacterized protein LOC104095860 [Nicotiana tomentosiformis]
MGLKNGIPGVKDARYKIRLVAKGYNQLSAAQSPQSEKEEKYMAQVPYSSAVSSIIYEMGRHGHGHGHGGGRAFLFSHATNVVEEPPYTMQLISDILCAECGKKLGWKYKEAFDDLNKYKEGKFAIVKYNIIKVADPLFYQ